MSWDDYRFFLSVARTGQLSLAGKQLGVDHTTVARRIKSLEEFLNAKLFDRSPRGYALTRAGERLLPTAESIEKNAAHALDNVGGQQEKLAGRIRIGVPEGVGAFIVVKGRAGALRKVPQAAGGDGRPAATILPVQARGGFCDQRLDTRDRAA